MMNNSLNALSGKVALVTGGSRGIGAAIVRRLVKDGAALIWPSPTDKPMNMVSHEFGELVAEHYTPLYKFAFSLTRAEADASDFTQQAFYLWATKGHQLRERSKAKTWLFTTLYRTFLEGRRRQTRFPHCGLDEVAPEDLPASSPPSDDYMDSAQVLGALAQVDEVYQGAVALFYLEDCSYREIAEILEVAEGTVKSRIARGITQLRHLMGCSASTRYRRTANPGNREETDCGSTTAHSESRAE